MPGDAQSTRGLLSINPSGSGYEAFADSLSTRGYIFTVIEITTAPLDLFHPQIKNLKQSGQIESLKQEGKIKWLQ